MPINPETGRKIKTNGPTHKLLMRRGILSTSHKRRNSNKTSRKRRNSKRQSSNKHSRKRKSKFSQSSFLRERPDPQYRGLSDAQKLRMLVRRPGQSLTSFENRHDRLFGTPPKLLARYRRQA